MNLKKYWGIGVKKKGKFVAKLSEALCKDLSTFENATKSVSIVA